MGRSYGGPYPGTKAETLETDKGLPKAESTGCRPTAEVVEERRPAEGNLAQQTMRRTQSRERMQQALERVRQAVHTTAFASLTQGRSPVRERRTLGSVRGAPGDWRPYRDYGSVGGLGGQPPRPTRNRLAWNQQITLDGHRLCCFRHSPRPWGTPLARGAEQACWQAQSQVCTLELEGASPGPSHCRTSTPSRPRRAEADRGRQRLSGTGQRRADSCMWHNRSCM
jgi:hypothetical protein